MTDYYKILGVDRNATPEEIKKQYRRLARKYHPDVSKEKDAEEKFKRVKEAYEVLSDPTKKQAYEQFGGQFGDQWEKASRAQSQAEGSPYGTQGTYYHTDPEIDPSAYSDFFESVFGSRFSSTRSSSSKTRNTRKKRETESTVIVMDVTLEEAFSGTRKTVTFEDPSAKPLVIKIPAGVREGQKIRVRAQHEFFLKIHILPHAIYTLDGNDVQVALPITPWEAALGAEIQVPTLGGTIKLKIPAGAQSGRKLRLKGRGLPGKVVGDQLVTLLIHTPVPQNDADKLLYQQMQKTMDFNPRLK